MTVSPKINSISKNEKGEKKKCNFFFTFFFETRFFVSVTFLSKNPFHGVQYFNSK